MVVGSLNLARFKKEGKKGGDKRSGRWVSISRSGLTWQQDAGEVGTDETRLAYGIILGDNWQPRRTTIAGLENLSRIL